MANRFGTQQKPKPNPAGFRALTDPRDFVLAQNKARRNCSASQLAAAAVKVYGWRGAGNPNGWAQVNGAQLCTSAELDNNTKSSELCTGAELEDSGLTASEIAEKIGVNAATVKQAVACHA